MFSSIPSHVRFPDLELEVLEYWKSRGIYQKSLAQRAEARSFVFFEGPPTANGLPHPGHCLTRAIKDLFPRYRTMRGYRCERKAGWDTHGLPVEVEVCKELGIHSKEEIEAYGVEPFIQKCQQSVWRYMREWERLTERLGFWVDLSEAYVTYHQSYVESVWWCLKTLFDRDLLYQGHKIVWWWAQGGTALSSGEVGQGYREVADPSVYLRFPLLDEGGRDTDRDLLVWTTTPWTLPSNQFAAVHPELEYAVVEDPESGSQRQLIMAAALVDAVATKVKRELAVTETVRGSALVGRRYRPPFNYYYARLGQQQGELQAGGMDYVAWRVVAADFVTTESGTGVVHQAPAFGEVDFEVLLTQQARFVEGQGPELICAVGPDGKFTDEAPDYKGRWVKEADKDICRELRARDRLFLLDQYLHDYPFCWRADQDPLIQYPRRSWFVRTTRFKEQMLANNRQVNWLPEHIRSGRFGNFLETNVDWALSRERYWGTPLPIWVCSVTGRNEAIASYDELLRKPDIQGTEVWHAAKQANPELPDDLKVHKPYIDAVTYASPFAPEGRMQRVSEVIDCWFDSGAMPFAQWGYPHQNQARFDAQFPADFISEAIDQTRGWFYSLLAISTLLFGDDRSTPGSASPPDASPAADGELATGVSPPRRAMAPLAYPHPFRNCIVLGLMLAEWWESPDGKQRFLTEEAARGELGNDAVRKVGKMSKQLRNYRSPQEIFDEHGADALRWYFFANQAPWNSIIYSERAIKESMPEFLLRLWNVFSFFMIYANIDEYDPADLRGPQPLPSRGTGPAAATRAQLDFGDFVGARGYRPVGDRSELDRWILGELHRTVTAVVQRMDAYDNFNACGELSGFVDALSNWYVRRSRDRFWSSDRRSPEKLDAYWTLYECLLTTAKLIAPFVPFVADYLWRNLTSVWGERALESVHLADYPTPDPRVIDVTLSEQMQLAREISSLGRSARMYAKLKVRQPLAKVEVVLAEDRHTAWLESHAELIAEELNVKEVHFTHEADQYISYQVQPNFKLLGPLLGKDLPQVKRLLAAADGGMLMAQLNDTAQIELRLDDGRLVSLTADQVQVNLQAREGWAAAQGKGCVVVLSTELTPALVREGLARDVVRLIQERRKEIECQYTDHIQVGIVTADAELRQAIEENAAFIQSETLADGLKLQSLKVPGATAKVGNSQVELFVMRKNSGLAV